MVSLGGSAQSPWHIHHGGAAAAALPHDECLYIPNPDHVWRPALSRREMEVVCLVAMGMTDGEIANELGISSLTASTHVKRILRKLDTGRRAAAATTAIRHGIIVLNGAHGHEASPHANHR